MSMGGVESGCMKVLSSRTQEVIDACLARFPTDKKRSAVLTALHETQRQNQGYLTVALMDAVADYLELPKIAVYEVASFYSMYELEPVARHAVRYLYEHQLYVDGQRAYRQPCGKEAQHQARSEYPG